MTLCCITSSQKGLGSIVIIERLSNSSNKEQQNSPLKQPISIPHILALLYGKCSLINFLKPFLCGMRIRWGFFPAIFLYNNLVNSTFVDAKETALLILLEEPGLPSRKPTQNLGPTPTVPVRVACALIYRFLPASLPIRNSYSFPVS